MDRITLLAVASAFLALNVASTSLATGVSKNLLNSHSDIGHFQRPTTRFTDRPVVGILTLPVTVPRQRAHGNSSFATSYARWLEAGGARMVPILYDSTIEELDYLLKRVNGILWTGGLVEFNPSLTDPEGSKYLRTTEHIWRHVVEENEAGNFYPIWGTCLGYERLSQLFANDTNSEILMEVDAENYGINLELTPAGWLSQLFGGMRYELFKEVASPLGRLAFNNHGLGIHPEAFKSSPLDQHFKILSIDEDRKGVPFVSTVEGKHFPYFGTQWHPEKAPWEWTPKYTMSHEPTSIEFSNYLGRFFVNECKYNQNKFEDQTMLSRLVVANWPTIATGPVHGIYSAYSEITFFPRRYPKQMISEAYAEAEASKKRASVQSA